MADFERENIDRGAITEPPDDEVPADMARCVLPFIESLPEIYREALLLIEFDGLSQSEAARRLGISNSGMKSRVQRARARMKEALLDCCAVELDRRGGIVDYAPRSADCGDDCSK